MARIHVDHSSIVFQHALQSRHSECVDMANTPRTPFQRQVGMFEALENDLTACSCSSATDASSGGGSGGGLGGVPGARFACSF